MNRKGQTLILFVIMIPIFLTLAALVIDLGLLNSAKKKLDHTTMTILKEFYPKRMEANVKEEIKESYEKNHLKTDHLVIEITDASLKIVTEGEVKSIFGRLIGFNEYQFKTTKTIREENNHFSITKE
jgi:hypothetical protein